MTNCHLRKHTPDPTVLIRILTLTFLLTNTAVTAEPDYLKVVTAYADALLTHGRDTYGLVRSPLIATTLDRYTYERLDEDDPPQIPGVRDRERMIGGANPMHDQGLYQILYALSTLTGDDRYGFEADLTLGWFLENCAHPATDLYAWGEHMGWHFDEERRIHKIAGTLHEFYRPWVLWDVCYILEPKSAFRFARGLWENQIGNHDTGNFSKHALYDQHGPTVNGDEPRHAGYFLSTWATAFQQTLDERYLQDLTMGTWSIVFAERRNRSLDHAMKRVTAFIESKRSPESGAIRADSATPKKTEPWRGRLVFPIDNLSLAVDLGWSAGIVEPILASKMRLTAARTDSAFLKMDHQPDGKGFLVGAHLYNLEPHGAEEAQRSRLWLDRAIENPFRDYGTFVIRSHAGVANLCYERFQQTEKRGYHDLVIKTARQYLEAEPQISAVGSPGLSDWLMEILTGTEDPVYPRMMGQAIKLMLNAYDLSGDRRYLERADYFAQWSIRTFLGDASLPRATHRHDHYEAVTGGDALMLALLELWAVREGKRDQLELVWMDR